MLAAARPEKSGLLDTLFLSSRDQCLITNKYVDTKYDWVVV